MIAPVQTKSVLVIDDDRGIREFILSAFRKHPIAFTMAGDGEEALRKVSVQKFDLVMTDLSMPVMGGFEFLRRFVRENPAHAPVIVISSSSDRGTVMNCLSNGAANYLTKPIDLKALRETVSTLLKLDAVRHDLAAAMADMVFSKQTGRIEVEMFHAAGVGVLEYEAGRLKKVTLGELVGIEALEQIKAATHQVVRIF
jgi:CheY-like chemotaxis protein